MARETSRDRVAWVTGASGTIGAAVARALAGLGIDVFASARAEDPLASLAQEKRGPQEGRIIALPVDVTDAASVAVALRTITDTAGHIDILVNSMTLPIFGPFDEITDGEWLAVLDVKLMGYIRTIRAVLPPMAAQNYGRIVNISGRGGRQPSSVHLPGACANAAVNLLTKGLADAYGGKNIRINAVAPGPIRSDRLERLLDADGRMGDDDAPGRLRLATPIPRRGTPGDVADAVVYLISDQSGYVTGTVLPVDGGGTATL